MALERWLLNKPKCVQDLAREVPPDAVLTVKGRTLYLIGYTEGDYLIVSEIDGSQDYERAILTREYLCAAHVRSGEIKFTRRA